MLIYKSCCNVCLVCGGPLLAHFDKDDNNYGFVYCPTCNKYQDVAGDPHFSRLKESLDWGSLEESLCSQCGAWATTENQGMKLVEHEDSAICRNAVALYATRIYTNQDALAEAGLVPIGESLTPEAIEVIQGIDEMGHLDGVWYVPKELAKELSFA